MRSCSGIVCALCLLTAIPAFSQERHPIDAALEKSIKEDWTTAGMANATKEAEAAWHEEVRKYYGKLMLLLDTDGREMLEKSQEDWEAYRASEQDLIASVFSKMSGTMWITARAANFMEISKSRALNLKHYYELLTEW